jgi:5-methylcytosine-specific restriction endonuclease McrA
MPLLSAETGLKKCGGKCRRELAPDHYAKDSTKPDKLNYWCKDCVREYHKTRPQKPSTLQQRKRKVAYDRRHYLDNIQARKERNRAYHLANPQVQLDAVQKRLKRMLKTSDGTITRQSVKEMLTACGHKCMFPGCNVQTGLTLDHVVPLQKRTGRKGTHSIYNIQILCRSHNSQKGTRTKDYRPDGWKWRRW